MTGKHQGVRQHDVLSSSGHEDDYLGDVVSGQRLASPIPRQSAPRLRHMQSNAPEERDGGDRKRRTRFHNTHA